MRFENMKTDNWKISKSFDNGSNGGDQFSRTNMKVALMIISLFHIIYYKEIRNTNIGDNNAFL